MRIIAGAAKGRRLAAPRGTGTRPFTGRAKESVFAVLGDAVEGARVLDLYAGSGSLGLEALSRGARSVTFVESSRPALEALRKNVAAVGLGGTIVSERVEVYLETGGDEPFDLVFVDPPYALPEEDLDERLVAVSDLVGGGGIVVVHRLAGAAVAPPASTMLVVVDRRRYGGSEVWWLHRETR